jgi:hypothetical protein
MKQHTAKTHPAGYVYAVAREKSDRNGNPRHRVIIFDGPDVFEVTVTGYHRDANHIAAHARAEIARELREGATA